MTGNSARLWPSCVIALAMARVLLASPQAVAADVADSLPTGQQITPTAARGALFQPLLVDLPGLPDHPADHAVAEALSPDGKTLLVLTSGYNRVRTADGKAAPQLSNEYVFVDDVTGASPRQQQVLQLPNTFLGICWQPDGSGFQVGGGPDDNIHSFVRTTDGFVERDKPIPLAHTGANGAGVKSISAGIAVSPDGRRLLATNYENDSVTLIDLAQRRVIQELDLRPGKLDPRKSGVAGGEYPIKVTWLDGGKAYVLSERDREVVTVKVDHDRLTVGGRIKLRGTPSALLLDRTHTRLYVAAADDSVSVIDTGRDRLKEAFPVSFPGDIFPNPRTLKGSNPNSLDLSRDGRSLFVTLGGMNAVANVALGGAGDDKGLRDSDDEESKARKSHVMGLIPTGWYPTAVTLSRDGDRLFVVNAIGDPGPNPGNCRDSLMAKPKDVPPSDLKSPPNCAGQNQYVLSLEKAGFLQVPMPDAAELARLTRQVATNDGIAALRDRGKPDPIMAFLRDHIKHVIYIVKENRTYDQVLGDLEIGNGDPRLVMFPEALTPNHHALARNFVTLDSFFDSGSVSMDGWMWSTAARSTDFIEKNMPMSYSGRARVNESQGMSRGVNVAVPQSERHSVNPAVPDDPDVLPGTNDAASPDAADGEAGAGYLWNAAIKAKISLRNYGFFDDLTNIGNALMRSATESTGAVDDTIPPHEPFKEGRAVYRSSNASLQPYSDPYYSGVDLRYPDFWRVNEWRRDFADRLLRHAVPALTMMSMPHDHFGTFNAAIDRVNTVEAQMADNDYALGWLVDTVAKSPIRDETLIFAVEDDAQDGPDHVNAHRTVSFVVGAYVKQRALVSTRYTTVNLSRTIEDVLGIPHMGLHDEFAEPMNDVFDVKQRSWSYEAAVPDILHATDLPVPARHASLPNSDSDCVHARTVGYWQKVLGDEDYSGLDRIDTERFNAALWRGIKGETAPPRVRDGRDLRQGRSKLLAAYRATLNCTRSDAP